MDIMNSHRRVLHNVSNDRFFATGRIFLCQPIINANQMLALKNVNIEYRYMTDIMILL